MNNSYLVSLHDLRADQWTGCQWAFELFEKFALTGVALALIPKRVEDRSLQEDFDRWCESLQDVIWLIHGFSHKADPNLKRSFWGQKIQQYCHDQAEFAGLNRKDCQDLLLQSKSHWNQRLKIEGFVAPTWHAPRLLKELCWENQWPIYESRLWLAKPEQRRFSFPISLPSLAHDNTWFNTIRMSLWAIKYLPMNLRIVLHPEDFNTPLRRARLNQFFQELHDHRSLIPYDQFI